MKCATVLVLVFLDISCVTGEFNGTTTPEENILKTLNPLKIVEDIHAVVEAARTSSFKIPSDIQNLIEQLRNKVKEMLKSEHANSGEILNAIEEIKHQVIMKIKEENGMEVGFSPK